MNTLYFLDGHVHLHAMAMLPVMLDSCLANMKKARPDHGDDRPLSGGILLAELPGQNLGRVLPEMARQGKEVRGRSCWRLEILEERGSLVCINGDGDQLHCILGRQLNSVEKIEVLLFGTGEDRTGLTVEELIESVRQEEGLLILPWGVGKWLGKRGRIVTSLLEQAQERTLCIGDNGNRPVFWPGGAYFRLARRKNIPMLRGTDSFSLPGEVERTGSFGNILHQRVDSGHPLRQIRGALRQEDQPVEYYGRLQRFFKFFYTQLRLRMKDEK